MIVLFSLLQKRGRVKWMKEDEELDGGVRTGHAEDDEKKHEGE